jgi:hypothetical protein
VVEDVAWDGDVLQGLLDVTADFRPAVIRRNCG